MRTAVPKPLPLLVLAIAGCAGMGRFDVDVTVDRAGFKSGVGAVPSIEVNLVGVNNVEFPKWNTKSMTEYWEPDDPLRTGTVNRGFAYVMTFGEEQPVRQVLSRRHPVWSQWAANGAENLFVLVNYPRVAKDQAGNADPRRKILPLERKRWKGYFWGKRVIWLEVAPGGLICHTPPKPPR